MKTIEAFRARKIEYLQFLMKCPERCGSVDQEVGGWLSDMLFVDERFGAWEAEKKRLSGTGRYSMLGVRGPFAWGLPRPLRADFSRPMYGVHVGFCGGAVAAEVSAGVARVAGE